MGGVKTEPKKEIEISHHVCFSRQVRPQGSPPRFAPQGSPPRFAPKARPRCPLSLLPSPYIIATKVRPQASLPRFAPPSFAPKVAPGAWLLVVRGLGLALVCTVISPSSLGGENACLAALEGKRCKVMSYTPRWVGGLALHHACTI